MWPSGSVAYDVAILSVRAQRDQEWQLMEHRCTGERDSMVAIATFRPESDFFLSLFWGHFCLFDIITLAESSLLVLSVFIGVQCVGRFIW